MRIDDVSEARPDSPQSPTVPDRDEHLLPDLAQAGQAVGSDTGRMTIAATSMGRILVVDDQAANLRVVGALLQRQGYEVIPASSGDEALARYAESEPDLILLDVMMPGMDGFEVMQALSAQAPLKVPVVFVTAAHDRDLLLRAFDAGVVDYVTKPFLPATGWSGSRASAKSWSIWSRTTSRTRSPACCSPATCCAAAAASPSACRATCR